MVAKIGPTSPLAKLISRLSPGEPNTPTAAQSFPTTATASRPAAFNTWLHERLDLGVDADPRKNTG